MRNLRDANYLISFCRSTEFYLRAQTAALSKNYRRDRAPGYRHPT